MDLFRNREIGFDFTFSEVKTNFGLLEGFPNQTQNKIQGVPLLG